MNETNYSPLDWSLDLILELNEEMGKEQQNKGISWIKILDALDALKWPRGPVEDIIGGALETGVLYEPVLGSLRLRDHDAIMGRIDGYLNHSDYTIHNLRDRTHFRAHLNKCRDQWDTRKAEPSLIDLRIIGLPRHVAEQIYGILNANDIRSFMVRPMRGD